MPAEAVPVAAAPVPPPPAAQPLLPPVPAALDVSGPTEQFVARAAVADMYAYTDLPVDDGATTISLTRRVPGATTVPNRTSASASTSIPARRPLDPGEARDLIEAFEFGVAQALREVSPDHRDEEDT
jgi:hypothetical protein